MRAEIEKIQRMMEKADYVTDPAIATSVHLAMTLRKPLLIEGHAGVGKTEIAKVMSRMLGTNLIRLRCYEGLDAAQALYEWNYPKQLLHIKLEEATTHTLREKEATIFSEPFLIRRPLLQAISQDGKPPVLLIDEVDRSVPPRGARRVPGDDPRDRHHQDRAPAVRHPHLEPGARALRRAPPPLSLPVDRLPGFREGSPHRHAQGAGRERGARPRDLALHGRPPLHAPLQGAGGGGEPRLGPGPGLAPRRSSRRGSRAGNARLRAQGRRRHQALQAGADLQRAQALRGRRRLAWRALATSPPPSSASARCCGRRDSRSPWAS